MVLRKQLRFELLEDKKMLAIVWANEGNNDTPQYVGDHFDDEYGAYAMNARAIVNRAIDDWNKVITSFNYTEDADSNSSNDLNDTFELVIVALEHPFDNVRGEARPDFGATTLNGNLSRAVHPDR